MTFSRTITDAFGDKFDLSADNGIVNLSGETDGQVVADLCFTPEGALALARKLTKAAAVAYRQETDATL